MKAPMIWCVAAHLAMVGLANAQAKDPWIGKRVFTQFGTVLKVGNNVVDDEGRAASLASSGHDRNVSRVYRVEKTNGDWLWLKDEKSGISGWVRTAYVIPYEQAIDFYTNRIRAKPHASLYNSRGSVWDSKGEHDIAIADYNEAIRLEPNEAVVFHNRGSAWSAKKDYEKAIADYNEAIRLDPKFATAYINRGLAWHNKKDYEKAIADYNEAIRLDPKFATAYINRGRTWSARKDYEKAIADYNEAIRLDPKYAKAYKNRGSAWDDKKDYEKAIADYDEAIRLDPMSASAYHNRGVTWNNKKDYEKAIADYDEAIRLDPKEAYSYNGRAWLWATCPNEKFRDGKKAVESATRACELGDWKNAGILDTLAAAYAESGEFEKAVEWQEKANKLYTDAEDRKKGEERLKLYQDKKPYRDEG